jgi:ketosteroid isomerase-like protein
VSVQALEDRRAAATAFVLRIGTGDFSGLPISADFSAWTPLNGDIDRRQYETAARTIAGVVPGGLSLQIDGTTAEADRVAIEASCRAMLRSGHLYHQHYHFLFEFRNGCIHRLRTHLDTRMVADLLLPELSQGEASGLSLKQ